MVTLEAYVDFVICCSYYACLDNLFAEFNSVALPGFFFVVFI